MYLTLKYMPCVHSALGKEMKGFSRLDDIIASVLSYGARSYRKREIVELGLRQLVRHRQKASSSCERDNSFLVAVDR